MKTTCIAIFLSILLALPTSLAAENLASDDRKVQVALPTGWTKLTQLNQLASLQAGSLNANEYLLVVTEKKADNLDLRSYSETAITIIMRNMTDPHVGKESPTDIGGLPALERQITGSVNGIPVTYLHYSVEGTDAYYQILTWSLTPSFEQSKARLETAARSFRVNPN